RNRPHNAAELTVWRSRPGGVEFGVSPLGRGGCGRCCCGAGLFMLVAPRAAAPSSFLDRLLPGDRPGEGVSRLGMHRGDWWQVPGRVIAQVIVGRRDLW